MTPGRLEVITGPMFSGKTEELIRRIRRHKIAGRSVAVFKPDIDTRYSTNLVVSHNGAEIECYSITKDDVPDTDVIGIDEIQLFEFPEIMQHWVWNRVSEGKVAIVAGLDMTFRREPFKPLPNLLATAHEITKLTAICQVCGNEACYTQRLTNGKPSSFDDDTIVVGGTESYEARCQQHFEVG